MIELSGDGEGETYHNGQGLNPTYDVSAAANGYGQGGVTGFDGGGFHGGDGCGWGPWFMPLVVVQEEEQ